MLLERCTGIQHVATEMHRKKCKKLGNIDSREFLVPCQKKTLCVLLGTCGVPERKDIFLLLDNKVDLIFEEEKCAQIIYTALLKFFKPSDWISIQRRGSCGDAVKHQGKGNQTNGVSQKANQTKQVIQSAPESPSVFRLSPHTDSQRPPFLLTLPFALKGKGLNNFRLKLCLLFLIF